MENSMSGADELAREIGILDKRFPKAFEQRHTEQLVVAHIDIMAARPEAIRVVVFGEFNAGKSSLINALLGRRVSCVDVMEKTAVVARYFESTDEMLVVHRRDGRVSRSIPTEPIADYLDAKIAELGADTIKRLDVGLPNVDNIVLIDTPGIGSRTTVNSDTAVAAIRDSDVILYCIPFDAVGGSRDMGTLSDLKAMNYPLVIVLTRSDLADSLEEVDEVSRWIANNVALGRERVIAVGGLHEGGLPRGLPELRRFLDGFVANSSATRERSRRANRNRLFNLAGDWISRERQSIDSSIALADRARDLAEDTARLIESKLRMQLDSDVETRLFSTESFESVFAKMGGTSETLRTFFDGQLTSGASQVISDLPLQVMASWQEVAPKLTLQFETVLNDVRANAASALSVTYNRTRIDHELHVIKEKATNDALGITAVAAATGIGLTTLTGAALGVAITGVGLPIAAIGSAISVMAGRAAARRRDFAIRSEIQEQLRNLRDAFRAEVLEAKVYPAIHLMNRKIVETLDNEFVSRNTPFDSRSDMDEARSSLLRLQRACDENRGTN